MAIKITFTKELSIDLNAYYASLSRKLRAEIDNEILALVTGERRGKNGEAIRAARKTAIRGLVWNEVGDDHNLTNPLRVARINGEQVPNRGKALLYYRAFQRQFGGNEFMMDDAVKFCRKEFPAVAPSTIITNLWRFGSMTVERLEK